MDAEFILIEIGREVDYVRVLISIKEAQGSSKEEINSLLEILERLESLRSRFLAHC